ncbi:hypothetical protein ACFY2M_37940 [Streptomyces sp. NPDC001276]|uniref:hypothetical protein n=1 Tax=Streptomyces sp. NPDC001276 TaxID=3364555 RepID=UPI00367B51AD
MWHTGLVALHALAGVAALASGFVAARTGRLFDVYLWSLAGMAIFLAAAVAIAWAQVDLGARVLFVVFLVLAGFLVWLAARARHIRPRGADRPSRRYLDHVGFTLVALLDAFAVIVVLDLGAPIWLVVATGVVIAFAGHLALRRAKHALVPTASPTSGGGG